MVLRAKSIFIRTQLNANSKNPKKFWRIIDSIINPTKGNSIEIRFYNKTSGDLVAKKSEPDFFNDYFIDIVRNSGIARSNDACEHVYALDSIFSFVGDMPTINEITTI